MEESKFGRWESKESFCILGLVKSFGCEVAGEFF